MTSNLRVAFIGARGVGGSYSGIETYYEEVGSRLAARGHRVTAYCRPHFTPSVATYRGIQVRMIPALRSKHLETITHSILSTFDVLRHDYDVIQYHAIGSAPLALIPRLFGRTTVVSVRGLDWQRGKWGPVARTVLKIGERASARCPTATAVVSRTLQNHYRAQHGADTHLIPNAVLPPQPAVPANVIRERFGLEKDGFLLFAGRMSPEKGVLDLIEAARAHRGRIKIALAGGPSYSPEYQESLHRAAWDDVLFLGNVDRATMWELYSNCYAYVLPSVMEGLSVSLLEALSFGACILTTNIPENVEVVDDTALTFTPGDRTEIGRLLGKVLDDPSLVADLRRRAAERARTQPDWDEVTVRTEKLYYDVLAARRDGRA